jgi:hypothetical protein
MLRLALAYYAPVLCAGKEYYSVNMQALGIQGAGQPPNLNDAAFGITINCEQAPGYSLYFIQTKRRKEDE